LFLEANFDSISMNTAFSANSPADHTTDRTVVLWLIILTEIMLLCIPGKFWWEVGLSVVALAILFGVLFEVLRGRGDFVIMGWVLIFPLGYYFFSFPREHPIITLDRVFLGILLVASCFADYRDLTGTPRPLLRSALYWAFFLLFAAVAIPRAKMSLNSLRLWTEAFLFPALLAWYVLRHFEIRRYVSKLHVLTCVMAIYLAGIGMAEVILQRDLLELSSGGVIVAGDYAADYRDPAAQILVRPNGPFSTVNSYAMVGAVSFFLLSFLKHALVDQMPTWQRYLHRMGVSAALLETLMPLFKSVLISLVIILLVDAFYQHGRRRILRLGAIIGMGLGVLALQLALPIVFEERADPLTFYARVAQEKQTLMLFMTHPINGVGLNNFNTAAQNGQSAYYQSGEALDFPHNNLGAVLAETGLTGFLPFVASQVLFVSAFWKLRQVDSRDSKLVWKMFLFLFLVYWINGMALTIAYFEDLNLWYMFVMAALYKFAITSPETSRQFAP
jgi:O-antigen ligase